MNKTNKGHFDQANESIESENNEKKQYIKPEIKTEELMAFGAICNGTSTGGRKQTIGAPQFCNSARLSS